MEEQFNNIETRTKKLLKEAGLDRPSVDFLNNVMVAVEQKAAEKIYKPLISNTSWVLIGGLLLGWMVVLYFYPIAQFSFLKDFNLAERIAYENPLSALKFSKTLVYGIGFLGLFLVQIPFLKNYMEKRQL